MYTLEQLRDKTFKELKEIGWELNVLPAGDRRCRQNWIDAIAGVNPPLLALLEVSPAAVVESVAEAIEVQAQEPIAQTAENSPGVEVEPVQEAIELGDSELPGLAEVQREKPIEHTVYYVHQREKPIERTVDYLSCPSCNAAHALLADFIVGGWEVCCIYCDYVDYSREHPFEETRPFELPLDQLNYLPVVDRPIGSFTEGDQPPNRGDNGRDRLESEPKMRQSATLLIVAENSPGVSRKTSTAHQLLELFKSSAHIIEDSPAAETEAEMLESAIGSAAKNLLDAEADDRNPILIGVTFSDRFLARYSPPQSENIHYQADANGQLSLLDFEVESVDEPPDPDDFECMFAFWAAYDAWCDRTDDDSVHNEPTSVHNESEPLEVLLTSLDSMCEWAPCPDEWYEPETLLEPAEVLEVSPTIRTSSTCNFSIPTFDAWCDRPIDKDEPPDTGVFARLPKPKPPSFPPMSVVAGDRSSIKKFARSTTLLSGRSPPGGDAM